MATTEALPDIGVAVPMPDDLNLDAIRNLSVGQLAYLELVVATEASKRMADPTTANAFAQHTRVSGADWAGHDPLAHVEASQHSPSREVDGDDPTHPDGTPVIPPRPLPTAPECLLSFVN